MTTKVASARYAKPQSSKLQQLFLVVGHPWCGKGTVCGRLVAQYPELFAHFDMGAAMRKRAENDPEFAAVYDQWKHTLVPDPLVFETMELYFAASDAKYLLVDGVPRNKAQGVAILEHFESRGWTRPSALYLRVRPEIAWERFLRYPRIDRGEHRLSLAEKATVFAVRTATFRDETRPMLYDYRNHLLRDRFHTLSVDGVDVIDHLVPQAHSLICQN